MKIFCHSIHSRIINTDGIFPLVRLNLWMDSHADRAAQSYMLKQFEHPQRCENSGFRFDMVQLEINGTDRLVGAVIDTPETGRCFFALAITNNHVSDKAFLQDLPHSLEQLRQGKRELTEIGSTYWLCATQPGHALLAKHPELTTMINPKVLNAILPESQGIHAGKSATYELCKSDNGLKLLKQYPHLAKMIAPKALNTRLSKSPYLNLSAAYWLCAYDNSYELLEKYPWLIKMIWPDVLNAILQTDDANRGTSAAYWLCANEKGRAILAKYPWLVELITSDALNAILQTDDAKRGTSAAYWLCATQDGCKLLQESRKLAKKITPEALNTMVPDSGASAAYWLCATKDGQAILQKYPPLVNMISADALNAILQTDNANRGTSAAYWLCATQDGRKLLKKFCELAKKITPEALNTMVPDSGASAAYWLCATKDGQAILQKYPPLVNMISADALNAILQTDNANRGTSAAYWLCATQDGRKLLKKFRELAKKITPEALNAILQTANANRGTSAAYWLCATEDGQAILEESPDLVDMITPATFITIMLKSADTDKSPAMLRCSTQEGRAQLQLFISKLNKDDYEAFRHALKSRQRKDILIHLTPTWASLANPKDVPPAPHQKIQSPLEASPAIAEPEVPYNGKLVLLPLELRRCESPPQISALTFSMFQPEQPGCVPRQHLPQPLIELISLLNNKLQKPFILTGSAVANLFLKRPHHSDYDCLVLGVSLESLKQFLHTHGFYQAKIVGKTYPTLKITIKKIEIEIATDAGWVQEPVDTYMQRIHAKRDFTISALYIDLSTDKQLLEIKAFDGALEKTEKGKISVVSDGDGLFEEDPIRLLRLLKIRMQYPNFQFDDTLLTVLGKCDKSGCFNNFLSANELHATRISTFLETLFSKFPEMGVIANLKASGIFEALTGISNAVLEKNSAILEQYFQEITQQSGVENQSHAYLKKAGFFFFCTALYCHVHDKETNLEDWPFYGVIQKIKTSHQYCLQVLQNFMWNQEREPQYEDTSLYRMLDQLKMHNSASILKP